MNGALHSEHVISRSGIAVFSKKVKIEDFQLSALRSAGVAFLSTTDCGAKALFSNATPKSLASRRFNWAECTPAMQSIQIFIATFLAKTVAKALHESSFCGTCATANSVKLRIFNGILVAPHLTLLK